MKVIMGDKLGRPGAGARPGAGGGPRKGPRAQGELPPGVRVEERRKVPGAGAEPVALHPGASAREAAREVETEQWAWRRVRALRTFYSHLTIYAAANFGLMAVDFFTPGGPWFFWPLLGWGLVIGMHAAQTYERLPWFTQDWEQRKVRELMIKARRNRRG